MNKINQRRLRQNIWIRELCRQYQPQLEQFIQPLFVVEGLKSATTITGLTDVYRDNPESLLRQIEADLKKGVKKFLLFAVPAQKHDGKRQNPNFDFACGQIATIKKHFGSDLFLAVDVCLCSTTPHGHCGILNDNENHVLNGPTVEVLAAAAFQFAQAGADCLAPSDMMDGRIAAIRQKLDSVEEQSTKIIMSYAAKFHSRFYGPFREAADSAPRLTKPDALKDRATYQIDPGTPRDALTCASRDHQEGADILMVKPGMPYLDVLQTLSKQIPCPWAVYQVSGEYAAIEYLAREGMAVRGAAHLEAWTSMIRAGAQMIISYGARNAKDWLKQRD